MKTLVIYWSKIARPNTQAVLYGQGENRKAIFIRVEVSRHDGCEEALTHAKPRDEEGVLNTIEV